MIGIDLLCVLIRILIVYVLFLLLFFVVIVNGLICMMISYASYLDRLIYLLLKHIHLSSMSHSTGLCVCVYILPVDLFWFCCTFFFSFFFFCVKIHHCCFSIPLPFGIEWRKSRCFYETKALKTSIVMWSQNIVQSIYTSRKRIVLVRPESRDQKAYIIWQFWVVASFLSHCCFSWSNSRAIVFFFCCCWRKKKENENKKINSWAVCDWFSVAHGLWFRAVFTELLFLYFFLFSFLFFFLPGPLYRFGRNYFYFFSSFFQRQHLHCRGF